MTEKSDYYFNVLSNNICRLNLKVCSCTGGGGTISGLNGFDSDSLTRASTNEFSTNVNLSVLRNFMLIFKSQSCSNVVVSIVILKISLDTVFRCFTSMWIVFFAFQVQCYVCKIVFRKLFVILMNTLKVYYLKSLHLLKTVRFLTNPINLKF